jgi:excisionase family DNA binding protein
MVILDGEQYLTGEEAAAALGIKRETLYAYVSRGVLRSYRQGIKRQRLYRQADVERLMQLTPSSDGTLAARGPSPEVPLAESWIRD